VGKCCSNEQVVDVEPVCIHEDIPAWRNRPLHLFRFSDAPDIVYPQMYLGSGQIYRRFTVDLEPRVKDALYLGGVEIANPAYGRDLMARHVRRHSIDGKNQLGCIH
jgi:hypothetical protein